MKSIIFTGDNPAKVRDGSKTQTRRIMNPQPPSNTGEVLYDVLKEYWVAMDNYVDRQCRNRILEPINSRYTVGDVLYVKEKYRDIIDPAANRKETVEYRVDEFGDRNPIVVDYFTDNPQRMMDKPGGKPCWKSPLFKRYSKI